MVLTGAILIGDFAGISFEEQRLAARFVGVDAAIGAGSMLNSRLSCPSQRAAAEVVLTMMPSRASVLLPRQI
jgi:hypothetical protein